jgi:hypothetical protein
MISDIQDAPPSLGPAAANWGRRWELASYVSQVIASVAVVVTLIYVGVQLQQNTAQLRRAENNATLTQFQAIRLSIVENRDVADLVARAIAGGQQLDPADALRLESLLSEFTWSSFHIWDRARSGLLDEDEFTRGAAPNLARLLCTEQGGAWWRGSRSQFVSGFVADVTKAIADMPRETCPDYVPAQPGTANG